jgi:hypothetical protein
VQTEQVKRSKTTEPPASRPQQSEPAAADEAEDEAEAARRQASDMRGYKVLEDGRKTTYVPVALY